MKFKNNRQRAAVMAKLRGMGFSPLSARFYAQKGIRPEDIRNKNFRQLQKQGIYLKYQEDKDHDGVKNVRDCQPLNPKKQGILHDWKMKRLRNKQDDLEFEHDKLRKQKELADQAEAEERKIKAMQEENDRIKKELHEKSSIGKAEAELKRRWNSQESIDRRKAVKKKALSVLKKLKKVRL